MMKEKSKSKKKSKKVIALCIILGLLIAAIIAAAGFALYTAYSVKNSSSPVGYWTVTQAESNGVVMTPEDAEAMGYDGIGSFTLNKSGSCKIVIMGKEYEGTWEKTKGRSLQIDCGEGHVIKAFIDNDIVMTATDENFTDYTLKK